MRRHRQVPPRAVSMPEGRAPHPAVVIGAEAYGLNEADRAAWDDAVAFLQAHTEG